MFHGILDEAERLWKRGEWDAASLKIEELEPIDRIMPAVIDLRLRICMGAEFWAMGDELVQVLSSAANAVHRQTCAEYLHARAVAFCEAGEIGNAKERVKWASKLWPLHRIQMLDDPALECLW